MGQGNETLRYTIINRKELEGDEFYDYYNNHDLYAIPTDVKMTYSKVVNLIEDSIDIKLFQFQKEMIFNIMCSRKGVEKK